MTIPLAVDPSAAIGAYKLAAAGRGAANAKFSEKARATAQDFEAAFLNTMFQSMFTATGDDGPLGGGSAKGVWRSFLTDEYSKIITKSGGIGIADQVYHALMRQQSAPK